MTSSMPGTGRATLTVPEAAQVLGIGRDAAYRAVARDEIPHLRVGRRILVPVAALERMLGVDNPAVQAAPGETTTDSKREAP